MKPNITCSIVVLMSVQGYTRFKSINGNGFMLGKKRVFLKGSTPDERADTSIMFEELGLNTRNECVLRASLSTETTNLKEYIERVRQLMDIFAMQNYIDYRISCIITTPRDKLDMVFNSWVNSVNINFRYNDKDANDRTNVTVFRSNQLRSGLWSYRIPATRTTSYCVNAPTMYIEYIDEHRYSNDLVKEENMDYMFSNDYAKELKDQLTQILIGLGRVKLG